MEYLNSIILSFLNIKGYSHKFLFRYEKYLLEAINNTNSVFEGITYILEKTNRILKVSSEEINDAINKAQKIEEVCKEFNIQILSFLHDDFPSSVKEGQNLWSVIYTVGNYKLLQDYSIGIIGTKTPNNHGQIISQRIGNYATEEEITLVLNQQKGVTVEVLKEFDGNMIGIASAGLDTKYSPLDDIHHQQNRCIVSPFQPGVNFDEYRYIEGCKLLACLSNRVILVQDAKSNDTRFVLSYFCRLNRTLGVIEPVESLKNAPINTGNMLILEKTKEGIIEYCNAKDLNDKTFNCEIKVIKTKNDFPQFFKEEELPF
ncbi:DNA-processing protein DprA [Flammeovirga pacifica]|uniref:Smf/DprA SLOG domain-containing protein n=1 Tax=Flammeovirga pacifica TaxID=915059 RepID=A0A1S1YSN0_FLAPC|nr:DNA-processing protein DprA [Flammeovirga pacifica]OHX64029.1 hypothetical protein NH26_20690 [Flammeovirga pacifica]